jgi:hypothetical protein
MKLKWDFHELYDFGKRVGNVSKFEDTCKKLTQELAKVLHSMLLNDTPVKTGELRSGWTDGENYKYTVKKVSNGFEVELKNKVPYALSVNDGHYSYNQYGGAYVVKNRTVPYTQGNSDATFVFGHFFVEKSILKLENSNTLEKVLYKELEKWFRWCVDGK